MNSPDTEIYFIRHAETVMNVQPHLVGGRSNWAPLTKNGEEQARALGRHFRAIGLLPDTVHSSPAIRALETARLSLEEMQLDIEPAVHDEIQELSQGIHEGAHRDEVYNEARMAEIAKLGKDFKVEGGESMNEVGLRMFQWVNATFQEAQIPGRHFVYTHGGAIRYLISHILGWGHEKSFKTHIGNTSVSKLRLVNSGWQVGFINRLPTEL